MKDYIATAQDRARNLIAQVAGENPDHMPPCQIRGDWVSNPIARALFAKLERNPIELAKELAGKVTLEREDWFDQIKADRGYINLRLGPVWYASVAGTPPDEGPVIEDPTDPPPEDFPALIDPGDWRFLWRTGRLTGPEMAARQDEGNPAWHVRTTAKRMAKLAAREGFQFPQEWSAPERELLRQSAYYVYRCWDPAPALAHYLIRLADQLWKYKDETCGAVKRNCARVLAAGYKQMANEGAEKTETAFPFPPMIPGMMPFGMG